MPTIDIENVDVEVRRLQHEVEGLLSGLYASEQNAQTTYNREAPALQELISENEEKIKFLQRENKTNRDRIVQLRNEVEAVKEQQRKVEAIFGRSLAKPVRGNNLPSLDDKIYASAFNVLTQMSKVDATRGNNSDRRYEERCHQSQLRTRSIRRRDSYAAAT